MWHHSSKDLIEDGNMETLKKYWHIIATFIAGILAYIFFVQQPSKDRKKVKQLKDEIKDSENKENELETKISNVEKKRKTAEKKIKDGKKKVKDLEKQINEVKANDTDIKEATEFLKDFAKSKPKKRKKK